MSYLKYETYNLPTAIVSNTLDYGKFDILDTTQYMKNTLGVWKALDFQFDAISTGFIVSKEQTQMITDFCSENSLRNLSGGIGRMSRPRIQITLIDQKGTKGCHRGHKIGDSYDFDTERGNLCPMAMHVAFPYVDILRYGGEIPGNPKGTAIFACPDVDTLNVFKFERIDEK